MITELAQPANLNRTGEIPARPAGHAASSDAPSTLNWPEAVRRVDGDAELLGEMAALFLNNYPDQFAKIAEAVELSDAGALEIHAHTLKGTARMFCAEGVVVAAASLEQMAEQKSWARSREALERLRQELSRMRPALEENALPATTK